jgi:shikimate kinase
MRRACLVVVALAGLARPAHADTTGTLLTVGYVLPTGLASLSAAVNATALAYDEPIGRAWKWLGVLTGGAELAIGTGLLVAEHDDTTGAVLGGVALGIGAAALATGLLVKTDEVQIGVLHLAGGAGVTVGGQF